jgi:hypothetical protein
MRSRLHDALGILLLCKCRYWFITGFGIAWCEFLNDFLCKLGSAKSLPLLGSLNPRAHRSCQDIESVKKQLELANLRRRLTQEQHGSQEVAPPSV